MNSRGGFPATDGQEAAEKPSVLLLSVLEAFEARFVSEEPGMASIQPCRRENAESQGWMDLR